MYYVFLIKTDLESAVKDAVRTFYRRHGRLPVSVTVNPSRVEEVEAVLQKLELKNVPVKPLGGCLVWEVWLEAEEHEKEEVTA